MVYELPDGIATEEVARLSAVLQAFTTLASVSLNTASGTVNLELAGAPSTLATSSW